MIFVGTVEQPDDKVLVPRVIHPSAWKVNSANFACTEFYEVRIAPVQHL
jgi:hypothetical protein